MRHIQHILDVLGDSQDTDSQITDNYGQKETIPEPRLQEITREGTYIHQPVSESVNEGASSSDKEVQVVNSKANEITEVINNRDATTEGQKAFYHCERCQKKFSSLFWAGEHIKSCGSYECDLCHKSFKNLQAIKKHLKTQHHNEKFKCNICNTTFSTMKKLQMHTRNIHDKGSIRCPKCDKQVKNIKAFRKHKKDQCEYRSDPNSSKESSTQSSQNNKRIPSLKTETNNKSFKKKFKHEEESNL